MSFRPLFGQITILSLSFVTFRVSRFHVSHLTHETFKLHLQNTLNMSKTTRVYFEVLQKVHQPYAIFVVEEDTLVVLVLLEMDPKRHQLLSQRRLGLKNQRSLTTKDPKRFGYLNLLDFF